MGVVPGSIAVEGWCCQLKGQCQGGWRGRCVVFVNELSLFLDDLVRPELNVVECREEAAHLGAKLKELSTVCLLVGLATHQWQFQQLLHHAARFPFKK